MDLFHFQEEGPGVVFWHPKGWDLFQVLTNYMRRRQNAAGYREVNAPQILDKALWETSGHWEWYQENMFTTMTEDDRQFAIKPMNCPGHVQIFKHGLRSYRELPYRVSEFGCVHRTNRRAEPARLTECGITDCTFRRHGDGSVRAHGQTETATDTTVRVHSTCIPEWIDFLP